MRLRCVFHRVVRESTRSRDSRLNIRRLGRASRAARKAHLHSRDERQGVGDRSAVGEAKDLVFAEQRFFAMNDAVMKCAQRDEIAAVGGTAARPMLDVMHLHALIRARREAAAAIALREHHAQLRGDAPRLAADVDDCTLRIVRELDRRCVAGELLERSAETRTFSPKRVSTEAWSAS